ncbi:MAG: glycosyltransferase family 2 protein [Planctomycetota bacterium]
MPSTGPTAATAPVAAPDRNPGSGWRYWLARQQRISEKWDRILLPAELWRDPFRDFRRKMVYPALGSAKVVYDVGGGRSPFIPAAVCAELDLTATGLDISPRELCAIRKDVWRRHPFPQNLPIFEDMGFAKSLLDDGGTIGYAPQAAVVHSHNYPLGTLFRRFYDAGAIRQRLGIWQAVRGAPSLARDGWSGLGGKLRRRPFSAAFAEVARDALKFAGLSLGRRERWLPLALKRRLTCFGIYDPAPRRSTER